MRRTMSTRASLLLQQPAAHTSRTPSLPLGLPVAALRLGRWVGGRAPGFLGLAPQAPFCGRFAAHDAGGGVEAASPRSRSGYLSLAPQAPLCSSFAADVRPPRQLEIE
ncbi:MAG: hypothetical protein AMXMBFR58_07610 [Phycisphaerae bacterium]